MIHFAYVFAKQRLGVIVLICIVLSSIWFSSSQAQSKSEDTTNVKKSYVAKAKPKKIKKRRTIYRMQSQSVAEELGLSKEQTDTLEVIYREMRKSHKLALAQIPKDGKKSGSKIEIQELKEKDQKKFAADLNGIMTEEQINKSVPLLCCFNPLWDNYVNILVGFELDKEKLSAAMAAVNAHMLSLQGSKTKSSGRNGRSTGRSSNKSQKGFSDQSFGRSSRKSNGGFSGSNSNMGFTGTTSRTHKRNPQEIKQHLDLALGAILTEDQMKVWNDATVKGKKKSSVQRK